ncbi:MAG: hypothetical protein FWD23_09125 [Oscillospiraceae bacterium]|nr:hypothetical protein [Oscillospiraceae bacterium]
MFCLSKRCEILKEDAVNLKTHAKIMELERLKWFHRGVSGEAEANPEAENICLTAAGLESVILNSQVVINDGELIAGCNYGLGEWSDCVDIQLNRGFIPADEAKALKGEILSAEQKYRRRHSEGQNGELFEKLAAEGAIGGGWVMTDNHTVIGYEQVLKLGFEGLQKKIEEYEKLNGESKWYSATKRVCRAACAIGERHAKKARELGLEKIAEICEKVPRHPANSFHEALQSLWFAHIVNTWEDGINANSLGRLDQILYPWYKTDTESGKLTKEEAFELICCLWIKLYRDYDVQQSCVGGCDKNGEDAANELSWLMLEVTEALNFIRCLSVRFSSKSDPAFIRRALEVVGHMQKGVPFFFNDDVLIPALVSKGISLSDARDYTQIGCVETVIPGKSNPHAVSAHANLLKAMEYALKDEKAGSCKSFDELKKEVFGYVKYIVEQAYLATSRNIVHAGFNSPKPYKSLLTEGCVESGRDFNGFGAKYDYYQMMMYGIPNLADSLSALEELVFAQNRYTMPQLIFQIENNWPNEAMRLTFVNKAPKFGNDIASADQTASEIMELACDFLDELSAKHGYMFHAQPFTFLWMVDYGKKTAATPDGRRDGEILAYSVSPMQGRDQSGFTALINSLSQLPTKKAPGTSSAIVEADPALFTDRNIGYFVEILLEGAKRGLCNVQFNVTDADTLKEAQKYPEKHKNLAVRVSGFSQKFSLLDKNMQDHIIGRTKHRSV